MTEPYVFEMPESDFSQLDESALTIHQCHFQELVDTDPFAALKLLKAWFEVTTGGLKFHDKCTGVKITEKDDGVEVAQGVKRQLFAQGDTQPATVIIRVRRELNLLQWLVTKDKIRTIKFDVEPPNLAF